MKKLLLLCALVAALLVAPSAANAQFLEVQSVKNPVHHGWNNMLVLCDDVVPTFCVPLGLNWFSNGPVSFTPIFFDDFFLIDGTIFPFLDGTLLVDDGSLIPIIG
jgi:hypothetical protein